MKESLKRFQGCVICISHDRYFLNNICTHIIELDGKGNVFLYNGNYSHYCQIMKK